MSNIEKSSATPRIAIWGNGGNNGFSLLRYLRDLGAEAHLFPFANEGVGNLAHFAPESDTWNMERWRKHVTILPFSNSYVSALDAPLSWWLALRSRIMHLLGHEGSVSRAVSRVELRRLLSDVEYIVGSGISPAVLQRIARPLDIFAEFPDQDGHPLNTEVSTWTERRVYEQVRGKQTRGVAKARRVARFVPERNRLLLKGTERRAEIFALPMVYVENFPVNVPPTPQLADVYARIRAADFSALHHAQLVWSKSGGLSDDGGGVESKNSDWLFHSIAEIRRSRPSMIPLLIVVDYGPDAGKSKQLCETLGITDCVLWLKVRPRREIMWLLSKVDVGIGPFYETSAPVLASSSLEVMAMARPLIHGFNFRYGEFHAIYGCDEPPFLQVRTRDDVTRSLIALMDDPVQGARMGRACRSWFDENSGQRPARAWLELLARMRPHEHHVLASR